MVANHVMAYLATGNHATVFHVPLHRPSMATGQTGHYPSAHIHAEVELMSLNAHAATLNHPMAARLAELMGSVLKAGNYHATPILAPTETGSGSAFSESCHGRLNRTCHEA
eukprot:scpid96104/ scgid18060/ 